MHATVCLLHAGRPTRAGDVAKSGQFIGQLSWVTGDPIGLKGLKLNGGILKFLLFSTSNVWLIQIMHDKQRNTFHSNQK